MLPDALQRNVRVFILQRRACKRYRAGQNLSSSRGEVHGNSAKVRARLRNARLQQRFHLQVFKGLGSRLLRKARRLHRDFSRFLDRFCGIADKENAPCYQHVQAKSRFVSYSCGVRDAHGVYPRRQKEGGRFERNREIRFAQLHGRHKPERPVRQNGIFLQLSFGCFQRIFRREFFRRREYLPHKLRNRSVVFDHAFRRGNLKKGGLRQRA